MSKTFPEFKTDTEAEHFVDHADLSESDFSEFKPVHFNPREPVARIAMDVPKPLLDAIRGKAARRGVSEFDYIRELLERDLELG